MSKLLLAFMLVSCGTVKTSQSPSGPSIQEVVTDCDGREVPKKPLPPGYTYVDGNRLFVFNTKRQRTNLCQILKAKNKKVEIMQLAGITCLSCQRESVFISSELMNSNTGHSVVFTDFMEDYRDEDFSEYMGDYSKKGSSRFHDDQINLWKILSKNPKYPIRPTILIFAGNGVSYLYNSEGTEISDTIRDVVSGFGGDSLDPDPAPAPPPSNPLKHDFALNSKKMSDVFTREFAVVDFSGYNCIYCRRMANNHNNDTAFQDMATNGKCDFITLVPQRDLVAWSQAYKDTFVGSHSFSPETLSLGEVSSLYGEKLRSTPTLLLIDRQGKVLDKGVGAMPRSVASTCAK